MIRRRSNDLSRYYGFLIFLFMLLSACGKAATPITHLHNDNIAKPHRDRNSNRDRRAH